MVDECKDTTTWVPDEKDKEYFPSTMHCPTMHKVHLNSLGPPLPSRYRNMVSTPTPEQRFLWWGGSELPIEKEAELLEKANVIKAKIDLSVYAVTEEEAREVNGSLTIRCLCALTLAL